MPEGVPHAFGQLLSDAPGVRARVHVDLLATQFLRLVQDVEGDADRVLKDRAVGADPRQDAQAVQGVD